MNKNDQTIAAFVQQRNSEKHIFTAGPASLLIENITGLRPCFGRGDEDYNTVEEGVLGILKRISGHAHIVRMQGSASLALEVMALNFLYGRVLILNSGYYSDRLLMLSNLSMSSIGQIKEVVVAHWEDMENVIGNFDWVFCCYTETSCGLKLPIEKIYATKNRLNAKLMLDATASIGLESGHELADVIAYSSCKGLFGLTGAAFVAYNEAATVEVDSFYLSITSHLEKKMTGQYQAIASLANVLSSHERFCHAVRENKAVFKRKMRGYLSYPDKFQPFLCTHVNCNITSHDSRSVLYTPRSNKGGSVVCHLGEVHLAEKAKGAILNNLEIQK